MNHYERLEVEPGAAPDELRRAYRRLALLHHPDHNHGDNEAATNRMIAINQAFATLSDPARRFDYDRRLGRATPNRAARGPTMRGPTTQQRGSQDAQPSPAGSRDDDVARTARREAKEQAAADAKRRGYRDPEDGDRPGQKRR